MGIATALGKIRPQAQAVLHARFCVVSVPRSGSNILLSLLHSRPDIHCYGELFNPDSGNRAGTWHRKPARMIGYEEDPVVYLDREIFTDDMRQSHAVGFKLFPEHTEAQSAWQRVWEYLRERDICVIYVHRENHLDIALSRILAQRSGKFWFQEASDPLRQLHNTPMRIDIDACIALLHQLDAWHADILRRFSPEQIHTLTYEQMCLQDVTALHALQQRLGLVPQHLHNSKGIERQRQVLRHHLLENYADVRERCVAEHPAWERFFAEETLSAIPLS